MSSEITGHWKKAGDGYFTLHNYSDAIACYMKIIESDGNNPVAWHCMGVSYENLGKHTEAGKCFREERRILGDQLKQKNNPDKGRKKIMHPAFSPLRMITIGLLVTFLSSFFIMALTYEVLGSIDWVLTLLTALFSVVIFVVRINWKRK